MFTPFDRILAHLEPYRDIARENAPKHMESKIDRYIKIFDELGKKYKAYLVARGIAFTLMYVSAISAVIGDLFIIGEALQVISLLGGLLGSAILLIIYFFFTRAMQLKLHEAQTVATIIISYAIKYEKI